MKARCRKKIQNKTNFSIARIVPITNTETDLRKFEIDRKEINNIEQKY